LTIATLFVLLLQSFFQLLMKETLNVIEIVYFFNKEATGNGIQAIEQAWPSLSSADSVIYAVTEHFRNIALCINMARWYLIL
jgi:hypothetical protein